MSEEGEIIEFLTISLARITGTLLLAVYNYNSSRGLVSRSALGIVLIILALILAHIGIQKKFSPDPLTVSLCFTVSALWSNSGITQLLVDNKILSVSSEFREALFPGLLAIVCGFLIIGCVGTLQNKGPLPLLSFALGLANIHVLALFNNQYLGSSGIGCNFMIVTIISLYLVAKRFVNILKNIRSGLPAEKKAILSSPILSNQLIVTGILANMVSSSVLCGKYMGTTSLLFIGQAHWMFTSAAYQIAVFAASFWAKDILHATFFSLLAVLRFAEGFSLLNQSKVLSEPLLPAPFMAVFAILFFALSCIMTLQNVWIGLYTLLFAIYCAVLIFPSGINHSAPQSLNLVIFLASNIYMFLRLYLTEKHLKFPGRKSLGELMVSCLKCFRIRPKKVSCYSYAFTINSPEVVVIGHAFNTLASFSMTIPTRATFMLLIAAGSMVHIAGFMSLSIGKAMESSAFIFYGVLWITWGFVKYITSYQPVREFYVALGIICFLVLNGFVTCCMTLLNKAWFIKSLLLEILLICSLLQTLNIIPAECVVAFSILFGIMSFYCFLSALVNGTLGTPYLPWGEPLLKPRLLQQSFIPRPLPAKKVTSIKKIAEIMNAGGICIMPADFGYVIASSCHFSDAVCKVSKINLETEDNDISVFITYKAYLQRQNCALNGKTEDFITGLCPDPVGLVLPKKGKWLVNLGLANSSMLLGSTASVTVFISDCNITTQIINLVGPIAVRKMGKTTQSIPGQAYPKLLGQVDGFLFDEAQYSAYELTIIDCMQLERGTVEIIKEGSISKAKVMDVLHSVTRRDENCICTLNSVRL